jgi:hypothetical protein
VKFKLVLVSLALGLVSFLGACQSGTETTPPSGEEIQPEGETGGAGIPEEPAEIPEEPLGTEEAPPDAAGELEAPAEPEAAESPAENPETLPE